MAGTKRREAELVSAFDAARADARDYEMLSRAERTGRRDEFIARIGQHRDAEVRRIGSRGASWESQISDRFNPFYDHLAMLYGDATGLARDSQAKREPPGPTESR